MKNILLITPTSNQVVTFRKKLIEDLQSSGFNVSVLTFDAAHKEEIENKNISFHYVEDKNRSLNPFKILSLKNRYCKVIKKVKPDIVFTFMLKPNIFGVLAAKKARVKNIFSMVEGAGDVFIYNSIKWRIIRAGVCFLYRKAFMYCRKVFFLNNDDKNEFEHRKLVKVAQSEVIRGIGVDLDYFSRRPLKNKNVFLMVARMLKTKGVYEYCDCARLVKKKYPDAVFNYIGAEGTISISDIREYIDDGSINYLGTTDDVRPYYDACTLYILPSYREGLPMSIMEAEAMGRAIIATNVNGCRDTVIDGYNGFLVPKGSSEQLAERIIWCIEHHSEVDRLCTNARRYAEANFDQKEINSYLIGQIGGGEIEL